MVGRSGLVSWSRWVRSVLLVVYYKLCCGACYLLAHTWIDDDGDDVDDTGWLAGWDGCQAMQVPKVHQQRRRRNKQGRDQKSVYNDETYHTRMLNIITRK